MGVLEKTKGGSLSIYSFQQWYIPARMMPSIQRYITDRLRPGNFLQEVISNDLYGAIARADDENLENLPAYLSFFNNEAPGLCWGSKKKMEEWIESAKGGIND